MCIEAKGNRCWAEFRQSQMREFSGEIVAEARRMNPKIRFVVKYRTGMRAITPPVTPGSAEKCIRHDLYGDGNMGTGLLKPASPALWVLRDHASSQKCSMRTKRRRMGLPVYLSAEPKWSLIRYDNVTFCLHSFRLMLLHAQQKKNGLYLGVPAIKSKRSSGILRRRCF